MIYMCYNIPPPLPMKTEDKHQACGRAFRESSKSPWGGGWVQKTIPHFTIMVGAVW